MNLSHVIIAVSAAAGISTMPARADINYLHLYMVGAATPDKWNADLPEEMTAIGGDCFIWDGYLEEGDFKFINKRGDYGSSIVATEYNQTFTSGESYPLYDNTNNSHYDHKFYNDRAGWVRVIVDLRNLSVKFRRPAVALVGSAALGWGGMKDIIPVFADDEGMIRWTGQLRQGELKFLGDGAFDWHPCFNAPWEGDILSPGAHHIVYNTSDHNDKGESTDFKFNVPRAGIYTLAFDFAGNTVNVETAAEPDLRGGFGAMEGRYMIGVDRNARRLHFGPVPTSLYIGTGASDYQRLEASSDHAGHFSSVVSLRRGEYYKLSYNPSDWNNSTLSPDRDVDITAGSTSNVAPMHGFSYTVPADDNYVVTADFSTPLPYVQAVVHDPTALETPTEQNVWVSVENDIIVANGDFRNVYVYDISGHLVGQTPRTRVTPGIYIVKIDNRVFKTAVR